MFLQFAAYCCDYQRPIAVYVFRQLQVLDQPLAQISACLSPEQFSFFLRLEHRPLLIVLPLSLLRLAATKLDSIALIIRQTIWLASALIISFQRVIFLQIWPSFLAPYLPASHRRRYPCFTFALLPFCSLVQMTSFDAKILKEAHRHLFRAIIVSYLFAYVVTIHTIRILPLRLLKGQYERTCIVYPLCTDLLNRNDTSLTNVLLCLHFLEHCLRCNPSSLHITSFVPFFVSLSLTRKLRLPHPSSMRISSSASYHSRTFQ